MSARVQSSPFRETEWDQRLDRMLDDLKSTVTTDDEDRKTPLGIRSSSRNSSRAGSVGRRTETVTDGGRLTHHHKEYTSPDNHIRTVADTYQYDSGDTHPSGNYQKKVVKSTYSSYNVDGGLSSELQALKRGPSDREMERALSQESRNILNSTNYSTTKTANTNSKGRDGGNLTNGHYDDDMTVHDEKGGEVRRIVWRNRYEKTYETNDSTAPTVSIEKDSRNRRHIPGDQAGESTTISTMTRSHVPPQISPGGQSWAEPIPLPTPPQVSPKDPGVAYIYNYGSSGGSAVQPLPPLNYVAVAPPEGGAPSPTPSNLTPGQPVIYHYSYHYTIQPGQAIPDGAHPPTSPPALQVAPQPTTGYSSQSTNNSSINKTTNIVNEVHRTTTNDSRYHTNTGNRSPGDREPLVPHYHPSDNKPRDGKPGSHNVNYTINTTNYRTETHDHPHPPSDKHHPRDPFLDTRDPPTRPTTDTNRNVTININKTTTHTTRTHNSRDGTYPGTDNQFPLTSTPYRGSSRSPERQFPSGPSDSLERVRRPPATGLPFPETSPVKPSDSNRIPRRVDDLMSDFPNRNGDAFGGPRGRGYNDSEPLLSSSQTRSCNKDIVIPPPERNEINTVSPSRLREEKEKTKNQAGPPVYYPPGHEAFSESMHTMTLKEGGRRGKAKWRREAASGYKESGSSSETKGGMAMVPVCLPLCCGAACTVM